jgi:hypothetical protein
VGKSKNPIKIARQEGKFVVANKSNYPADTKQINDLISKALDIKTGDLCTSDPKNHEDLQVTEDKAKSIVKFFKADGSLLAGVVVGQSKESAGQGTYVRLASSDDVYTTEENPWFHDRAIDFVSQDLTSAKREDVNSVTVTTPEGTYALRSAKGSDNVLLVNMPADKKLKDADAKSVFSALTGLRFEDVNTPAQIQGLTFDHEYVCRMSDSTEYRLKLAQKGVRTYLQCEADYLDKTPVTLNPNQKDSQEELKKKEAKLLGKENALKFGLRHKGWIYEIADWKAKFLTMKQSALLEDKEKPAEKKAETPKMAETPAPGAAVTPVVPPATEPNQPKAAAPQPVSAAQPATPTPQKATPEPVQATQPAPAAEPNQSAKVAKPIDANAPKGKP